MDKIPVSIAIDKARSIEKFVYATWLRQFKESYFARSIKPKIFFPYQSLLIERIFQKETSLLIKAHLQEDEDQFFGYSIVDINPSLSTFVHHFTFVKMEFRKMGIGSSLMKFALDMCPDGYVKYYSHNNANSKNSWVNDWIEDKWGCAYNPYTA